jgi:hypothetical protein
MANKVNTMAINQPVAPKMMAAPKIESSAIAQAPAVKDVQPDSPNDLSELHPKDRAASQWLILPGEKEGTIFARSTFSNRTYVGAPRDFVAFLEA